jgi:predicted PurR-regulated permease PerM
VFDWHDTPASGLHQIGTGTACRERFVHFTFGMIISDSSASTVAAPSTLVTAEGAELLSVRPSGRFRAAGILLVLGFGIVWAMLPFMTGIFGAAIFYVLSVHAYRWLVSRRVPRTFAALLMLLVILLVILIPGGALVTVLVEQVPTAIRGFDSGPIVQKVQGLRIGPVNVGEQLARTSGTIGTWASSKVIGAVGGVASGTLNLVISLMGLYYLLIAADEVWPRVKRFLPFNDDDSEELRTAFFDVTIATALGVVVVAVVQGVLVGVAFAVLGLPNAIVWGSVTAVASVLPLFGSALVWVPATIALFALGNIGQAVGLALFGGVVVSNIDNIMRPLVSQRVSNLHPLTTLLGAFAGIQYLGLIGVLLGPLAITWFFELLTIYDREYGLTDRFNLLAKQ